MSKIQSITCPCCGAIIAVNAGRLLASVTSEKRAEQSRVNGRKHTAKIKVEKLEDEDVLVSPEILEKLS